MFKRLVAEWKLRRRYEAYVKECSYGGRSLHLDYGRWKRLEARK